MEQRYVYTVDNNLYINLTNRCSNRCEFCVRYYDKPIYGDLWIKDEPTAEQVIDILEREYDISDYGEVVFCGYGEPTYKFDEIVKICDYVHSKGGKTRINTNGQGSKINGRDISGEMSKVMDTINVSLNATDKVKYDAICHSDYGLDAFDIMLDFARNCVKAGGNVVLSVVDCIGQEEIDKARKIAREIGAKLRVRELL
ncbi:MAG: TatD family nuclease-associated radical SAM protein [Clostridia bacterium]|nr:TatD family nuclease-associated radical SAM protein [Clostridia bacterium]MDY4082684.1 TatD family nuclease-associated radical SAM protein [Eubacteriales bacterium]